MASGGDAASDVLVRAVSEDGSVSLMVLTATELVREAVAIRPTSATAAGALGRALMGALLMAASKKSGETIQIQLRGKGPLGTVTAIADAQLHARGTLTHREANVRPREDGRPDVSQGVGRGVLGVVRHHPSWREPYSGFVPMTLRDIAKDLTRYLMESEQAPSALGLSIEHADDGGVGAAAAFLAQALPGSDDATLAEIEANVKALPRAATLVLGDRNDADRLLELLAGSIGLGERSRAVPRFHCPCDRARAARALRMLESDELRELIASGQGQEVECQFCGRAYQLEPDELSRLVGS
ncbi:MAG: Hsp33 family molecular chaperone HslO [Myxococcota bacterium]|nr:Hsp33 family molecular chaperone HslO [Myxococcota bacterium]